MSAWPLPLPQTSREMRATRGGWAEISVTEACPCTRALLAGVDVCRAKTLACGTRGRSGHLRGKGSGARIARFDSRRPSGKIHLIRRLARDIQGCGVRDSRHSDLPPCVEAIRDPFMQQTSRAERPEESGKHSAERVRKAA